MTPLVAVPDDTNLSDATADDYSRFIFMFPSTKGDGGIMFSGGPFVVRPLTRISPDTIRLYLMA